MALTQERIKLVLPDIIRMKRENRLAQFVLLAIIVLELQSNPSSVHKAITVQQAQKVLLSVPLVPLVVMLEQQVQVLAKIAYQAITALKLVLHSLMDFAILVISAQSKPEDLHQMTTVSQELFVLLVVTVIWDRDLQSTVPQELTVTLLVPNLNSIARHVMLESIV